MIGCDMHSDSALAVVADWIVNEHKAGNRYRPLPAEFAIESMADAYRIQAKLADTWSMTRGAMAGYKIALTSKPIQELCGINAPIAGRIYADTIHHGPAVISLQDFGRLGLEFELAVRVSADLKPMGTPWTAENVRSKIATLAPAFELIEDRSADYDHLDACSMIADNAWSGGVVLGPETAAWQHLDLVTNPVTLTLNGSIESAVTGAAMGHPLTSLAWVANLLNDQGTALRAGDLVITGSTLATRFANLGDKARYHIDGLGHVELTITA